MSTNEARIEEIVTEAELVIYSDDHEFTPEPENYKTAEKAFLASQGRKMRLDERAEMKHAFELQRTIDADMLESQVVESCGLHKDLIMSGHNLPEGVERFEEAVLGDIKEAMSNMGISYSFDLESYTPTRSIISGYIEDAMELGH